MLRATSDLLDAPGIGTALFASAEEFLDCRGETKFDCLLLDIHFSGMSGLDLRQHLTAANCSLPVIFMTALDDQFTHEAARQAGCVTVLRKPYSAHQLMDAIQKAASGHVIVNLGVTSPSPRNDQAAGTAAGHAVKAA